jgi:hypothetical protein
MVLTLLEQNERVKLCSHRVFWRDSGRRAPVVIYCASVSPIVGCVSAIVRPRPTSVSDNVRRNGHLLRVGPFFIVRRYI